jgi:hypothetical protein
MTWSSALLRLGRCLLTLMEPLRETVGDKGMPVAREAGKELKRDSWQEQHPTRAWRLIYLLGRRPSINTPGTSWACLMFVHRQDNGIAWRIDPKRPRHLLGGSIWRNEHG